MTGNVRIASMRKISAKTLSRQASEHVLLALIHVLANVMKRKTVQFSISAIISNTIVTLLQRRVNKKITATNVNVKMDMTAVGRKPVAKV